MTILDDYNCNCNDFLINDENGFTICSKCGLVYNDIVFKSMRDLDNYNFRCKSYHNYRKTYIGNPTFRYSVKNKANYIYLAKLDKLIVNNIEKKFKTSMIYLSNIFNYYDLKYDSFYYKEIVYYFKKIIRKYYVYSAPLLLYTISYLVLKKYHYIMDIFDYIKLVRLISQKRFSMRIMNNIILKYKELNDFLSVIYDDYVNYNLIKINKMINIIFDDMKFIEVLGFRIEKNDLNWLKLQLCNVSKQLFYKTIELYKLKPTSNRAYLVSIIYISMKLISKRFYYGKKILTLDILIRLFNITQVSITNSNKRYFNELR